MLLCHWYLGIMWTHCRPTLFFSPHESPQPYGSSYRCAKTFLPQTWHIPSGEKIGGSASTDVTVMECSSNPRKTTKGIKSTLYNSINTECLPLEELCSALSNIDKSCIFLSVVDPEHQQKDYGTKFGNFPKGSSLATQQKLHSDYVLIIMDAEEFPPLPVRNVMRTCNSVSVVLDHSRTLKLESLSISDVQANEIEEATRLQSEDRKCTRFVRIV